MEGSLQNPCPINALQRIVLILKQTLDHHAPFITKRIKGKPSPWMTEDLKKHMNTRDQLKHRAKKSGENCDLQIYCKKRNFVKNEISRAKQNHFKNQLSENAKSPDRFWKLVKDLFPVNSKSNTMAKSFNLSNGESTTDKHSISDGFCKFYSTIANKLKGKTFFLKNFTWNNSTINKRYSTLPNFQFTPATDIQVLEYLRKLKRKCATGLDDLPACYLKDIAFIIEKQLTHANNLSLASGVVPNNLKSARFTTNLQIWKRSQLRELPSDKYPTGHL